MWAGRTVSSLKRRVQRASPFDGDIRPVRAALFGRGRPSAPIPLPWNYHDPIQILATYYHGASDDEGHGKHTRYFDVPGLPLGVVTRDPGVIKAILLATGDKPGQFDRDPAPARGIARFTGEDTMLYANGEAWRNQKKIAAPPFGQPSLFQPEKFGEFEETFRETAVARLDALRAFQEETGQSTIDLELEPEISAVMLEMLVNNFFGADVPYEELRERYVPAITNLIARMTRDTVGYQYLRPLRRLTGTQRRIDAWKADFEQLVDIALAGRRDGKASWAQFKSDVPDEALRSNIRVFLAGALEATTSFAAWAISHLSHRPDLQERLFDEVRDLDDYHPENLAKAEMLHDVLQETLRLTPALYFLPRLTTQDTWVETDDGRRLHLPADTHVVLDVFHANRCEDFWGVAKTGYPADRFEPDRWRHLAAEGRSPKDKLHFGFGHGARVCPGKFLGLLEVSLVVGAIVKMFRFEAVHPTTDARAGVSTKPADGALVRLTLRDPA